MYYLKFFVRLYSSTSLSNIGDTKRYYFLFLKKLCDFTLFELSDLSKFTYPFPLFFSIFFNIMKTLVVTLRRSVSTLTVVRSMIPTSTRVGHQGEVLYLAVCLKMYLWYSIDDVTSVIETNVTVS